jgi:multidrug resistance efflux pump
LEDSAEQSRSLQAEHDALLVAKGNLLAELDGARHTFAALEETMAQKECELQACRAEQASTKMVLEARVVEEVEKRERAEERYKEAELRIATHLVDLQKLQASLNANPSARQLHMLSGQQIASNLQIRAVEKLLEEANVCVSSLVRSACRTPSPIFSSTFFFYFL